MQHGGWTIGSCAPDEVEALVRELGLSEITASVLVRRGYGDPDAARTFLAGEPPAHDPFLLGNMTEAVATIRAAIAAGKRICVHGDYDVDGICATALALLVLRGLGRTPSGTCRRASTRATAWRARRSTGWRRKAAASS